jgi:hypothetical protein
MGLWLMEAAALDLVRMYVAKPQGTCSRSRGRLLCTNGNRAAEGISYLSSRLFQVLLVAFGILLCQAGAQEPVANELSVTTQERLEDAGWWPTKGDSARTLYVGSEACKTCHQAIAAVQETTPMYHAAARATQSEILKKHPQLVFQEAGFRYSFSRSPLEVTYSVSNGADHKTANATWAFGVGEIGQTYVLEKDGTYIEGRVTYYTSLDSLDITPGHSTALPGGVEEALGTPLDGGRVRACFSCHTTAAVTSRVFESEKATPGVTCEACHGPGTKHVAAMKAHEYEHSSIINPAHLPPSDSIDFCGACHRTWSDVAMEMPTDEGNMSLRLRFQPYRLEESRCWKESGDPRITCIACHDPHQPLVREPTAYDSKCLTCHSAKPQSLPHTTPSHICKKGSNKCVSCHMPKYKVPQTHARFTDHDIQVIRANERDHGDPPP